MNLIKQAGLSVYRQFHARRNLYHLRDRRAYGLVLDRILFESAEIWPEVLPCKPRSIVDIGANRGNVAMQLAALYRPEFVGLVEPLPQMAQLLREQSFAPRQKVFECALGRTEGRARLNVLRNLPSSSLLEVTPGCDLLFQSPMDKIDVIDVPLKTFDSIYSECHLDSLDLLKIDVQGYEIEVFEGGRTALKNTRFVLTEVSFFSHYHGQPLFAEVYEFLRLAGFELRGTFGYSCDSRGMPLQCDAIFINTTMRQKP
jgi:FkbM family methyltransferase